MNIDFIRDDADWCEAEARLAKRFGLNICPTTPRGLELIAQEVERSEFQPKEILDEFKNDRVRLHEFCARWYADCMGHDYGEQWNPEEGNQQDDLSPAKTDGMSQGFMVGYTAFYLYAKRNPAALADYVKRRRIPAARKVARDILRVFAATMGTTVPPVNSRKHSN
jgi:hypothetical protein